MNRFFTCLFVLLAYVSLAQPAPVPTVSDRLDVAGLSVRLDRDAQRIVQQDVNSLLANRRYWDAKLDRALLYFPIIEAILLDEGVPTDFKYLAVQESSLTPDAVSSSAAVGYWQFKRETANNQGLRVDEEVDERKSITASTRGAATYLKKSNAQYNNWISSLYSYYLGATGISKLVSPDWAGAGEVTLDGRTDRYILRFMAHKVAIENGLKTHKTANTMALIEYPNGGGKTLRQISDELNASGASVDEFELRKYNRWLLGETVPTDKVYVLAVPVAGNQINDVRQKIVASSPQPAAQFVKNDVGFPVLRKVPSGSGRNEPVLYEINDLPGIQAQAGDNAASLARKARISLSSFLRYNDMSDRDPVITNDVYYLAKKRKKALVPYHTAQPNETARTISQRYGVRLKKLLRYNRIDRSDKLQAGRVMWLRERRPANKPVEIIKNPTPPVYDRTPATAGNRPVIAQAGDPDDKSALSVPPTQNTIPRNASERKLYQPKLVEPVPSATPAPTVASAPARQPAPTYKPAPVPAESAPVSASTRTTYQPATGSNTTERTIVIRSAEGTRTSTTPAEAPVAATRPADRSSAVTPVPAPVERSTGVRLGERSVETTVAAAPKAAAPTYRPTAVNGKHTVEAGQTYYSISKLYGLSIDDLLALNKLTADDKLAVGQQLLVAAPEAARPARTASGPASRPAGETVYHTVEKGETMFRISKQYGVTIEQIQTWNELSDNSVKAGQRIKIVKQL